MQNKWLNHSLQVTIICDHIDQLQIPATRCIKIWNAFERNDKLRWISDCLSTLSKNNDNAKYVHDIFFSGITPDKFYNYWSNKEVTKYASDFIDKVVENIYCQPENEQKCLCL